MSLTISDPDQEQMIHEIAPLTGKRAEDVIETALTELLAKEREVARRRALLQEAQDYYSRLPVLDDRTPDEIIGYNDVGAFD